MELNPVENDESQYSVLVNHDHQHSLWAATLDLPQGWTSVYGPNNREACIAYIGQHWTDMRAKSLSDAMNNDQKAAVKGT